MPPLALRLFPFLAWRDRITRATLRADLLAGIVGALVVLPQAVAYATLAGLPPQYGLYCAMLPVAVAALWGSSWHQVSGPTNTISLAVFATVAPMAAPGSADYIRLVLTLTLLVGVEEIAMGLARLGALVNFISHTVVVGFTAGAGLLVSDTGVTAFVGRLVLARIVDQVHVRRLAWLIMALQTTALLAIALWPTAPVLIAASLVYGYGIGHVTTLGPVVVRREFGAAAFGATYGAAATVIQLTSAFGPALFGFLRDSFGGYGPGLLIAALLTALGGLSLFIGSRAFRPV